MEAVLFIGVPAVGKTTFYKHRFFSTHIRINLDMLRTRHRQDILIRACLEAKQPFVIDNTNPTIEERVPHIALAKANQFRVVGYYFQSKARDALERNAQRPEHEQVPDKAIFGKLKALERPSLSEGFDSLYYVRIAPRGEFLVEEWNNEL
jgi:predicted kinase